MATSKPIGTSNCPTIVLIGRLIAGIVVAPTSPQVPNEIEEGRDSEADDWEDPYAEDGEYEDEEPVAIHTNGGPSWDLIEVGIDDSGNAAGGLMVFGGPTRFPPNLLTSLHLFLARPLARRLGSQFLPQKRQVGI